MTVLKDVSWEVKPQKRLAICGPSGSGKSTIVELILRFYDPTSGKIVGSQTCLDHVFGWAGSLCNIILFCSALTT